VSWIEQLTEAQRRVARELFLTGQPRPHVDAAQAPRLRQWLEQATAAAAQIVPAGQGLVLGKSALDALDCDGRFLDREDSGFEWNTAMLRGQLAHSAVAADHWGERARTVPEVVDHAWREFATRGSAAGTFLATLGGAEADALRGDACTLVTEFRDLFPPLPATAAVRAEPTLEVALHDRRLRLRGQPDLVLGASDADRRRMLLLDLKTGQSNPLRDRAEMRFYALLATLKYGVAPFRVATFYLDGGTWDAEDVDDDVLEAAARTVADKAERAARLTYRRPPEEELRLVAGAACRWCSRAPTCPLAQRAGSDAFYTAAAGSSYSSV
jgi:hypothetical protein